MTTVLITGAYRGIGFEVARQLGERGFHVFVTARRRDAGTKAAATLQRSGAKISFVELDVTDAKSIRNAVESVAEQVDHLDVLVNNAAILEDGDQNILRVEVALVAKTLDTNALGPLRVAQAFLPLLAKSHSARIINVSSGAGQLSDMGTWAPAYSISKTALNGVTAQLAGALRDKAIAVNSVCPGWVRTEMGGPNAPRSVEEGADTIVWLATEAPRDLTGKFLRDRKEIPW
jgi:NAD(P)-dependent dehydrogenase (short-subunit alcohol dehydrogenase family)